MIQKQTKVKIIDNTGAKVGQCIHVYKKKTSSVGNLILITVKQTHKYKKKIEKGKLFKALVVRTKAGKKNKLNNYISFNENSVILLNENLQPKGTRIFGPIPLLLRELKQFKLMSISSTLI